MAFPGLEVPRWQTPESGETLAAYGERFAASLADSRPSQEGDPLYLGGVSLGGMVALEMARFLRPSAVFLIASCRSPRRLSIRLKVWKPFIGAVPVGAMRVIDIAAPVLAGEFGARLPEERQLFADMIRATPPSFIKWASWAILNWDGVGALPMPVHQIHGDRDRIVHAERSGLDRLVKGAGHLLNLTHASAVNEFLAERMLAD